MSHLMDASAPSLDRAQLDRLCTSIRGKLQFMDYLVRATVADLERYEAEPDVGTRLFLRQLIEMHASTLTVEGDNMRPLAEFCELLDTALGPPAPPSTLAFSNGGTP